MVGSQPAEEPLGERSLASIESYIGKKLEVVAFGISYIGFLKDVDLHEGTIVLSDGGTSAILELERVDSYFPVG